MFCSGFMFTWSAREYCSQYIGPCMVLLLSQAGNWHTGLLLLYGKQT